jgi:hypothetical protein
VSKKELSQRARRFYSCYCSERRLKTLIKKELQQMHKHTVMTAVLPSLSAQKSKPFLKELVPSEASHGWWFPARVGAVAHKDIDVEGPSYKSRINLCSAKGRSNATVYESTCTAREACKSL